MMLRRFALQVVSAPFPERFQHFVAGRLSRRLKAQLCDRLTDDFLETLLRAMDLAFLICGGYRKNIRGFRGTLVFRTTGGKVAATAVFKDGRMAVKRHALPDCDVRVSFRDARALWSFLLAENQDILDSILANTVDVDGNLNYLYRFGFLAQDLTRRLGVGRA
jgi:hypothetical protein